MAEEMYIVAFVPYDAPHHLRVQALIRGPFVASLKKGSMAIYAHTWTRNEKAALRMTLEQAEKIKPLTTGASVAVRADR